MRTQKIITINIVDENNAHVKDSDGKNCIMHLDEEDCNALIEIAKSKHGEGLSDREYMEIAANEALREIIESSKDKKKS